MSIVKTLIKAVDNLTNSMKTMDNDHNYIHDAKLFIYNELISGLAASGTKIFAFTTPANTYDIHWRPAIVSSSGDKVYIELLEDNTLDAAGTNKLTSVFNSNRQSSKTTNMQTFASGSTIDSAGTMIKSNYIGGGTGVGQSTSGASVGVQNEIVLKQDTIYCVRVTNGSGNANNIHIQLQWYEEDEYTFS